MTASISHTYYQFPLTKLFQTANHSPTRDLSKYKQNHHSQPDNNRPDDDKGQGCSAIKGHLAALCSNEWRHRSDSCHHHPALLRPALTFPDIDGMTSEMSAPSWMHLFGGECLRAHVFWPAAICGTTSALFTFWPDIGARARVWKLCKHWKPRTVSAQSSPRLILLRNETAALIDDTWLIEG